jgi:hypothetical protein
MRAIQGMYQRGGLTSNYQAASADKSMIDRPMIDIWPIYDL